MASITTRPVRVCLLLVRCLKKLTASSQSSPPPLQGETAVPPSGPEQGENQRTFSDPTQQSSNERKSRRETRGWAKSRGPQRIGYVADKPNRQNPMEGSGSWYVQLTCSRRSIALIDSLLAFAKVCGF